MTMIAPAVHFSVPTYTVYINVKGEINKQLQKVGERFKHGPCGKGKQTSR